MNWGNIKREIFSACLFLCVVVNLGFDEPSSRWQRAWSKIPTVKAQKIYVDTHNHGYFWILSNHSIYYQGPHSNSQLSLNNSAVDLVQNPLDPNEIYVVTENGIYKQINHNVWNNVLLRHDCRAIAFAKERIFVATDTGLIVRTSKADNWNSVSGKLAHQPTVRLASYGEIIYAATPNALYRYDAQTNDYKEIFSTGTAREVYSDDVQVEEEKPALLPEIIDIDVPDLGEIYVSTRRGIYHTQNDGIDWDTLPVLGISSQDLNALSIDPKTRQLWVATNQGIFQLENKKWVKQFRGLPTSQVFDVVIDLQGDVYVATNRGFFVYDINKESFSSQYSYASNKLFSGYSDVEDYFQNEPTIHQVHLMAIDYADVHPDKIKRWHKQSRLKALVPSLTTGIDRSASDLMHWDTGPNPDVLSKGRDFMDWDVGLSWDLGEMVWSSDQTSIDSRSKLMVELREEVLDQVTRIYFERRRVQLSLLSDEYEGDMMDEEMRLAELTAIIDGYTGGQFSRKIKQR